MATASTPHWHVLFCDEQIQGCPVSEFIETRQQKHQVKILRFLDLLEQQGPTLPRPYADILREGIHELRIKLSGDQVRLLYFFCYQRFIILYHAFVKNTDRVPERIIDEVIRYRSAFLDMTPENRLEAAAHADA
ncbi:MAG: type II toxin-antitoxin system RelE/ParE family toxin [Pseudomonadota bacterium]